MSKYTTEDFGLNNQLKLSIKNEHKHETDANNNTLLQSNPNLLNETTLDFNQFLDLESSQHLEKYLIEETKEEKPEFIIEGSAETLKQRQEFAELIFKTPYEKSIKLMQDSLKIRTLSPV